MEVSKSLLEAIKQALQDEAVGKGIYHKAAENAKDKDTKEFFYKMSKEEESHIDYLNRLYKHIDTHTTDHDLIQDVRHNFKPTKEIFNKTFLDEISKNENLLLALNTSATLEKNAIAFYENCVKLATEKDTKEFFKAMVVWETAHLNKILDIFENLDDSEISFKQDDLI